MCVVQGNVLSLTPTAAPLAPSGPIVAEISAVAEAGAGAGAGAGDGVQEGGGSLGAHEAGLPAEEVEHEKMEEDEEDYDEDGA